MILLFFIASCNAENVSFPSINSQLNSNTALSIDANSYSDRVDIIGYASEITNASSSLQSFSNKKINDELQRLKFYLKDYIGAIEAQNATGKQRAYQSYEKSYKKIQGLKANIKGDEAEVLNRYLVLVKTNMSNLENKTSTSNPQLAK